MAVLVSVNVGMPRDEQWEDRTVRTGIWKAPQPGSRMARRLASTATARATPLVMAASSARSCYAPDRLGVSADAAAYGCGPTPFMAEVHGALAAFGLPSGRIRSETFGVLAAPPA